MAKYKLFHSYTLRLTCLYAAIFGLSTLLLLGFFYLFTASYMTQQMDNTIQTEIQGLAERYDNEGLQGLASLIAERVKRQQQQATGNSVYLLTTYTLKPIVGNLSRWPKDAAVNAEWLEFALEVNAQTNQTHLVRAKVFQLPDRFGGRYGLLVGRDVHQLIEAKQRIKQALIWGLVIMVLLAFVGGVVLSRRTVRKLEHINQTTRDIMDGALSQRVALSARNDDFDQLASNLNRMLDRIQTLMEDIRRVSDNIAHDLRTPLARLRQHLEKARAEHSDVHSAHNLENAIKEADSLLSTFNALLRIARIEASQVATSFSNVNLHTLMQDIVEFYEPLAEAKQQHLTRDLQAAVFMHADRDLLFQAFANIVENAIKYTPARGRIDLVLCQFDQHAIITIADNGPGVPAAERERVFRRFYRLDQSRTTSGNGLGLCLVYAVMSMHNGQIELHHNHPNNRRQVGLKVLARLPTIAVAANAKAATAAAAAPLAQAS